MKEWLNEKMLPLFLSFFNAKPLVALRNGMTYTIPVTIAGSLFFLLAHFPIRSISEWITSTGVSIYLDQVYKGTFAVMSFWIVSAVAYAYTKEEGVETLSAGIVAAVAYLLLILPVEDGGFELVLAGGQGILGAVIVGLLAGWGYSKMLKYGKRLKLGKNIPENVLQSFVGLIPALMIVLLSLIVSVGSQKIWHKPMIQLIHEFIQLPVQSFADSLIGVILLGFFIPFLWLFGVHGSAMINGLVGPVLQANSLANAELLASGKELTVENGGHIVTQQFLDQFMTVTGAGLTLGIVCFMVGFARSETFRQLGKLSVFPAIFNINESIIFSTPIVMNPMMAVPFILTPVLSGLVTYTALYFEWVPLFTAVQVPWTTPPILSGFLVGGIPAALLQGIVLILGFFIYLPFLKKIDDLNLKQR
ncbi:MULTISPECIES: PTS transporter subunit EIIC [unclassified Enterococcus]|uniref:PTS sugar transporter subunit IIC n=1 Tax=unclassified Enterococcus TaxID=2608891 RepID=UPI0013ED6A57|nr:MULTISPECIES: PTS transporter subunit EIIC [unclassified Enterococcus]